MTAIEYISVGITALVIAARIAMFLPRPSRQAKQAV
jgi:hypothetical protein